jgi:hypothetical protein
VSKFEASCEDKMKIDRLSKKEAELDARLAASEKKHDEGRRCIEELEAQMRGSFYPKLILK